MEKATKKRRTALEMEKLIGQWASEGGSRWDYMAHYLTDGSFEIDNNLVENSIRAAAIGRKNYLFAGNHESAQRIAVLYTLLSACKQHGVNPEAWLTDVLNRMYKHPVNRLEELLPQNWKPAEQPEPEKEKAEDA